MRFRYKMGAPGAPGAPESPGTPRASGALEAPEIGSYIFLVHATETAVISHGGPRVSLLLPKI